MSEKRVRVDMPVFKSRVVREFPTTGKIKCIEVSKHNKHIYVLQQEPPYISVFHIDGGCVRQWNLMSLVEPICMKLGPRDVRGFHPQRTLQAISECNTLSTFPPGVLPMVVDYLDEECIYVLDNNEMGPIRVLDITTGSQIYSWGKVGDKAGQLSSPTCFAIDSENGTMWIYDSYPMYGTAQTKLQLFQLDGTFIRGFKNTQVPGSVTKMAIDKEGRHLYLKDPCRVWRMGVDGTYVGATNVFESATALTLDPKSHCVCVSDRRRQVIHVCDEHGKSVGLHQVGVDHQLTPSAIALSHSSRRLLFVADRHHHRFVSLEME